METSNYHPEEYWSEVGKRIEERKGKNVVAGDDEPYYRYKREEFLKLLKEVDFKDKSVLEIGNGPGGNLVEIYKLNPSRLVGVDISEKMVKLAKEKVSKEVEVIKIDGKSLPFKDKEFDIVFTATVLQHNTDEDMLKKLVKELSRVSKSRVILFERVETEIEGDELCQGRPVEYYETLLKESGFKLESTKYINIRVSYYVSGIIRKGLNRRDRKEGERLNFVSEVLQTITLPITRILDKVIKSNKDICRIEFVRE
ncbi:MAG: methyltransferase domain-containing protein [Saprospiraceae bacterium]